MKIIFHKITLILFFILCATYSFGQTCVVPQSEKDALMALYNATNGPNWTNTLANNQAWDVNTSVCDWYGVTVSNGTVTELSLSSNGLSGTIPVSISNLVNLNKLQLNNNNLSGSIPSEIGNLSNLNSLRLYTNQLTGPIPSEIGNLTNLKSLNLSSNQLTGAIPIELSNLVDLTGLTLFGNQLSGTIPTGLGNLTNLTGLSLYANQLSGNIPAELGNLTALNYLRLSDNQLSGNIPSEIGNLTQLTYIHLGQNVLSGNIPVEIGNLTQLTYLDLYNNQLSGNIPTEITNLTSLTTLTLSKNQLAGSIPSGISFLTTLQIFKFYDNNFIFSDFENEHPTYTTNLTTYTYSPQAKVDAVETPTVTEGSSYTFTTSLSSPNNSYQWYKDGVAISGATSKDYTINPVGLTDAGVYYVVANNSIVTGLTLQRNDVTLTVTPDTCGVPQTERDALMALYNDTDGGNWTNTLANNQPWNINTPVCDWYGVTVTDGKVTGLNLNNNNLSGTIPSQLGDLSNLQILNLAYNALTGSIPSEFGSLSLLNRCELQYNQLTGAIPSSIGNLINLDYLVLSHNQITSIPSSIQYLTNLTVLYVSNNQLSAIPSELGMLTGLVELSLHKNQITGSIPTSFGGLTGLYYLHLNDNQLSGTVPSGLTALTHLTGFKFHNNKFVFEDFEADHPTLEANISNFYVYSPQAKVDQEETINLTEGDSYTLTTSLSSPNNHYQWEHSTDGVNWTGVGTDSSTYVINSATSSDVGIYRFTATNNVITGLILERNTITINVAASNSNVCFSGNSIITESQNKIENNLTLSMKDGSTINFIDATVVAGFFGDTEVVLNQPFNSQRKAIFNTTTMGQSFPFTAFRIEYAINSSSGTYENSETIYSYDWVQPAITANFQCSNSNSNSNTPPTANAGVDDSIILPINTYTLDGSQSFDSDGTIVSYLWTKVSGGTVTFSDANIVNPQVTDLEEGTYVFQLTVTDNDGLTATDTVTVFVLAPGQENSFCTSEWSEYPTINNLTPSGSNIEWYATETGGVPLDKTDDIDLEDESGTIYWWDDITDNISTRTAATIMVDQGTLIHDFEEEYQFLPTNATVADLQMTGTNIQWFDSAFSQVPLNSTDFLVHGATYYVEDVGTSTCRLAVEVYVGTVPPEADNIQYVCPNATLNDLIVIPQIGATLVWYDSETGGNILSNTVIQDGVTYYAAQIGADTYESFERTPINVIFNEVNPPTVPSNTQKFYSNEEHTVANLLAKGNNVKWYTEQGNLLSENTTVLENGLTYYAEQTDGGCISERIPVTVVILEEELPTIISCEKFKPQIGGHYVISGWVREQGASATPGEVHDFTEVSDLFVELLNHLKDKLLSDNLFDLDMPSNGYIPESEVDFDPLVQFVQGIQSDEYKLTVYNFKRIEDDYGGIENGRLIGFQFALNKSGFPVFEYRTPTISVPLCPSCFSEFQQSIEVNYPLLGNGSDVLDFTNARVSNGSLYITQSFNAINPSLVINDQEIQIPGSSPLLESITYYDYSEASYYQPPNYDHVQIELSYIGEDDQIINDEIKIFSPNGAIIDGWQKIVGEFTIPSNAKLLNINLKSNSTDVNAYFDDIRIHPFDSNMKTFVYHPETQRLMSELDENNYATFYEYDLEGGLVRVKKETEKGIYTIQETRSGNVKASNN
ncbi:leucine-rich repeat domain-containing protein [Mariniflexile sp. HMF6888]|uniref:leucine-rich repeat domain-containing protein n=1 Tax=Mariniflexile sp. HMF6888 TaxID=3373086 RepID=UPI0037928512